MIHAGKFEDTYFILDVESGSLHSTDVLVYDIATLIENGTTDYADISDALSDKYPTSVISEALMELNELQEDGLLNCEPLIEHVSFNKPVIKSLCLNIAHDCNLNCTYCFAANGMYSGERQMMSEATAKAALDFLVARSAGRKQLEVDFFGGEPLLNFPVVKACVQYGRELEKIHNKIFRFTLTTNAYHVTDEMADFLNKEMKNIVVSIDGRKEIHDSLRPNMAGEGSFDRCLKNATLLVANREKEYYIRGTYTSKNLDFADDVLAIADMGFSEISLEPVVTTGELELLPEHIETIDKEYQRLGRLYEQRRRDGRPFHFFHFTVDFSSGPCLNKRLRGCGAGTEYVAIAPDGGIYPCHQFDGLPEFLMGNVLEGTTTDKRISSMFANCHVYNKPECKACYAKYFCSGGCAANAYKKNGDLMKPHSLSCEIQRRRLDVAIALYIRNGNK